MLISPPKTFSAINPFQLWPRRRFIERFVRHPIGSAPQTWQTDADHLMRDRQFRHILNRVRCQMNQDANAVKTNTITMLTIIGAHCRLNEQAPTVTRTYVAAPR